jgi:iron complex transport system permease protein
MPALRIAQGSGAGGWWALAVLAAGLLFALVQGRTPITLLDLWALASALLQGQPAPVEQVQTIVLQIRGPRILAAIAVGAGLAVAGTAFQGLFRNPLVSPDILGASAGAALGAVLGIYFSLGILGIQSLAFAGGLLAVALVYGLGSAVRQGDPVLVLLLTGVVIGSLLGAGIGLVKYLADPYNQLPAMTFWLLGSLAAAHVDDMPALIAPVLLGSGILLVLRWRLDVMSLPEEEARSLGARTTALRLLIVAAATLVTAASVAAAGIVGWVGLIVPHLARFLVGPSFVRLLPTSALLGGGFLLFIDTLARTLAPVEIPLGILTALIGSPFFIVLLRRASRGWA